MPRRSAVRADTKRTSLAAIESEGLLRGTTGPMGLGFIRFSVVVFFFSGGGGGGGGGQVEGLGFKGVQGLGFRV